MNKILLIGYIGGEPEIRHSKNSEPICTFRVATNERTNSDKDHTEWFSIVTFGKTAVYCSKRVSRGVRVYVEGKLRTESYTDASGISRFTLKVFPSDLKILEQAKATINEPLTLILENCIDPEPSSTSAEI